MARSSTEEEYRSLADTTAEIMWLQSLLTELNVPFVRQVIYCDNLSTVMLSHNSVLHSCTKHMELSLFFVREKVMQGKLLIAYIPSPEQQANLLTKAISKSKFIGLKGKLMVRDLVELRVGRHT